MTIACTLHMRPRVSRWVDANGGFDDGSKAQWHLRSTVLAEDDDDDDDEEEEEDVGDEADLAHRGFNTVLRRSGRETISAELWYAFREWLQAASEAVDEEGGDEAHLKERRRRFDRALHSVEAYDEWMAELEAEMDR